jgi:hypothetical protein
VSATLLLHAPIVALKHDNSDHVDVSPLPPGTQLQLCGEVRESGLIDVTDFRGAVYTVFAADLFERSHVQDPASRGTTA